MDGLINNLLVILFSALYYKIHTKRKVVMNKTLIYILVGVVLGGITAVTMGFSERAINSLNLFALGIVFGIIGGVVGVVIRAKCNKSNKK